jgi:hypothetical protein
MTYTAERLEQKYGPWGSHPKYPVTDWQYEVASDYTRRGYWEWVAARIEAEDK